MRAGRAGALLLLLVASTLAASVPNAAPDSAAAPAAQQGEAPVRSPGPALLALMARMRHAASPAHPAASAKAAAPAAAVAPAPTTQATARNEAAYVNGLAERAARAHTAARLHRLRQRPATTSGGQRASALMETQSRAQQQQKSGADPWWLKNPPWWMPPPPSWGPLPPTFFNEYYRQTEDVPPMYAPNTYPLNRRAMDLEPPVGFSSPLRTGAQNLLPPKPPAPMNGPNLPPEHSDAEFGSPEWQAPVLLEVAEAPAASAGFTTDTMSGPQTIADHLTDLQVIPVPPELRYDRGHRYGAYWRRRYEFEQDQGHPYSYKFAPAYPPNRQKVLAKYGRSRDAFRSLPFPHPSWFATNPVFPSKYDETTAWQLARLEAVRREESDPKREQWLRNRLGAGIPLHA